MYRHKNYVSFFKLDERSSHYLRYERNGSWWGMHNFKFSDEDSHRKWFESLDEKKDMFFECRYEKSTIGYLSITNIDWISMKANLTGVVVSRQRANYSKQAFEAGLDFAFEFFNFNKVESEVLSCNIPAIKLEVNHLGFDIEGVKKNCIYKIGRYYDSIMIGMTRNKWMNLDRVKSYGGLCCENAPEKLMDICEFQVKDHLI